MRIPNPRTIWLILALSCAALVIASFVLTAQFHLHPCHLCILQRLLFILVGVFALPAAFFYRNAIGKLSGGLSLLSAATGIGVAGYQVWLQSQPVDPFSCTSGTPELVERLVDWLGGIAPSMFMATGLCQEVEMTILKLSFAGWGVILFTSLLVAGNTALWKSFRKRA